MTSPLLMERSLSDAAVSFCLTHLICCVAHMGALASLPAFLTVDELAVVLRCQPEKVYRLAARGELPSYKVEGRRLFNEAEVVLWLEGQRQGVASDLFERR